jgi:hypothetical protein
MHVQELDIQLKAASEQVVKARDGLQKATVICHNATVEVAKCAEEKELSHAKWETAKIVKVQRAEKQVGDKEGNGQEKKAYKKWKWAKKTDKEEVQTCEVLFNARCKVYAIATNNLCNADNA